MAIPKGNSHKALTQFLLVPVGSQSFFALMGRYLVFLLFLTARHLNCKPPSDLSYLIIFYFLETWAFSSLEGWNMGTNLAGIWTVSVGRLGLRASRGLGVEI